MKPQRSVPFGHAERVKASANFWISDSHFPTCHSEPVRTLAWESHEITVEIATGRSGPRNDKIGTFLPARGTGQSDSADYTRYIFTKE